MKDYFVLNMDSDDPKSDMLITIEHNDPEAVRVLVDDIIGESIGSASIYMRKDEEEAWKDYIGTKIIKTVLQGEGDTDWRFIEELEKQLGM